MKKKILLLLLLGCFTAAPGFSQSGGGTPPSSGSSSQSTLNNESVANVNDINNARGYAQPLLSLNSAIPAFVTPEGRVCYQYTPQGLRPLTRAVLKNMTKDAKLPHGVKFSIADTDGPAYDGPLGIIKYNPEDTLKGLNDGDEVLGDVIIQAAYLQTDSQVLALASIGFEKRAPKTGRIAVIGCTAPGMVTKGSSKGVGAAVSTTPGSGAISGGITLGYMRDSSESFRVIIDILHFYALNWNDGKLELPPPPPPLPPQNNNPPAETHPEPPPAVLVVPKVTPPAPPPPPPTLPSDELAKLVVHFAFGCHDIDEECVQRSATSDPKWHKRGRENEDVLKRLRDLLVQYPAAKVDVIGSADHYNTFDFNAVLSYNRADTVLRYLQKNYPEIAGQLFEPDGTSKYHAQPTGDKAQVQEDRTVIFRIHCADSSGK